MDGPWAVYAAALALGAAHALEVDHMVAVTAFIGGRPRVAAAAAFGLRWGLGHAAVVMALGGLLAWSGARLPAAASTWGESAVGVMLLALGLWTARRTQRLHVHPPDRHGDHAHLHAHLANAPTHEHTHAHSSARRHRHLSTVVGAVHGFAGTAPAVALIPVTLLSDRSVALGYLAAFGLGTTLAMGAYAAIAARAVQRVAASPRGARALGLVTAVWSIAIGLWWLVKSVPGAGH
ncbi:MAG TPA: hypothetical protein VNL18_12895 [Gemmatimonadales bacterium]|nr:hypothetical protein [Gemmatimonadales bacterium]